MYNNNNNNNNNNNLFDIFGNRCLQYESTLDRMMFLILDTKALL